MPRQPPSHACRRLLFGAVWLLCSSQAIADRASFVLDQTVSGETNLFRTSEDEEGDGSYQVRPRLRLQRFTGEWQYDAEYSPTYDAFFNTGGIDGFDQFGHAELTYSPTPTGSAHARTELAYYRSIRSSTVDGPTGIPEVTTGVSGRVFRAITDFGYQHSFSATTVGEASLGVQSYEYTSSNNADSIGVGGQVNLLHELRPSIALGGLLLASHRRFEDEETQPESRNTVFHLGPMLRLEPIPTVSLELVAGPALVLTDEDSADGETVSRFRTVSSPGGTQAAVFAGCGVVAGQPLLGQCPLGPAAGFDLGGEFVAVDFAPGSAPVASDDETLTAFARFLLRKDEPWGYTSLAYFRAEDPSSGSGPTTLRDSVTATLWVGEESWEVRLRANWNQRETVDSIESTDVVAGPSPILSGSGVPFAEADGLVVVGRDQRKVTQYWGEVLLARQISPSISIELEGRYLNQDRSGADADDDDDFDNWRGSVTVRVQFPHLDYGW